MGTRRLLRADAARATGEDGGSVTAAEVLGNIEAMTYALQTVQAGSPITVPVLLEGRNRRLLGGTALGDDAAAAFVIRQKLDWRKFVQSVRCRICTAATRYR